MRLTPAHIPVGYSGTGAGVAGGNSFTDTIPTDANCTVIWVGYITAASAPTISAQLGSNSAVAQATSTVASAINAYLTAFTVINPPSGVQTITFNATGLSAYCIVETVHYKNVASIGAPVILSDQTGATCLISADNTTPNAMYANAFSYRGTSGQTFVGYNQTQRFLAADVTNSNEPIVIGDAPGNGATLTFSATRSNNYTWGGIIIPFLPL
ncbi:hypothetical protein [Mycobacterium intracellulare]|uniref:hypothetical protein n=1 Tax=Mycobacterium intracellulare TaxID=1767 RepID=UPI00109E9778|nr:hypothetical protein [Mycobacterium intracellulare]